MTTEKTAINDEDLVYVDPKLRQVVGKVEWDKSGTPIRKEIVLAVDPKAEEEPEESKGKAKKPKRKPKKRYYPWGTYRTMRKIYRLEGKEKEAENYKDMDTIIKLAVSEPYWD